MTRTITIPHSDKLGSVLLLGFSTVLFVYTGQLQAGRTPEHDPGPAFFPRLILAGIAILAVIQLAQSIRDGEQRRHEIPVSTAKSVVTVAAALLVYVALLPLLGFLLSSMLFLAGLLRYSGETNPWIIGGISVGLPVVLFAVFAGIFNVPLPENEFVPISRLLSVTPGITSIGVS